MYTNPSEIPICYEEKYISVKPKVKILHVKPFTFLLMELSQKCLGALFQFKQMVLLDATCMEPIVQEVVEMVKPAGKQGNILCLR